MNNRCIWLDGLLVPEEKATVSLMTHTLHYGSGAFEGIRCYDTEYGPAIFRLSDHVDRLLQSFSVFRAPIPFTKQEIEQAIIATVRENELSDCYIRPLIFFGAESLLLNPRNLSVHCAIIAIPLEKYLGRSAIKVGISSVRRLHPESAPLQNKLSGFYLNSILAHNEALDRGFDEALLLDYEGKIAEGSVANIFFVVEGVLKTPPSTCILPGITRDSIMEIAKSLQIPVQQEALQADDIAKASEAFFTGTASEITPIKSIEQVEFMTGPDTVTARIKNEYDAITHAKNSVFKSWLTFINQ